LLWAINIWSLFINAFYHLRQIVINWWSQQISRSHVWTLSTTQYTITVNSFKSYLSCENMIFYRTVSRYAWQLYYLLACFFKSFYGCLKKTNMVCLIMILTVEITNSVCFIMILTVEIALFWNIKYSCTFLDQISTLNIDKSNITTELNLVPMSASSFSLNS
jgi:hypothetical protein